MYHSSPGMRDLYQSDGLYSPQFISYDKWGNSEPWHLYGPPRTDMLPEKIQSITQTPILIKNYEILRDLEEDGPAEGIETFQPLTTKIEKLEPNVDGKTRIIDAYQFALLHIIFIVMMFVFDKSFGKYIEETSLWIKMTIMIALALLIYYVLTQDVYIKI